jgi:kinesin family protein 2/24
LTEEGQLLQTVQGEGVGDYEIDEYASRLGRILDRKSHLIASLQEKIASFRGQLKREEELSRELGNLSSM